MVVAVGAVDANYGVTGINAHALSFKSAAQCDAIAQRLKALKASSKASRVTIIGGGITGVEALGEILRLEVPGHLKITLLEAQEQLLPNRAHTSLEYSYQVPWGYGAVAAPGPPARLF